jgi:multidrug efflux pump subunit AcrB
MNTQHLTNGTLGQYDGDVMVALKEDHHPTAAYIRELREKLPRAFPQASFYFLPADITTQILNFGIPAPIDIQLEGNDVEASKQIADELLTELRPRRVDIRNAMLPRAY